MVNLIHPWLLFKNTQKEEFRCGMVPILMASIKDYQYENRGGVSSKKNPIF